MNTQPCPVHQCPCLQMIDVTLLGSEWRKIPLPSLYSSVSDRCDETVDSESYPELKI